MGEPAPELGSAYGSIRHVSGIGVPRGGIMAEKVEELALTEGYGRSKRASQLYSAALVVLGFVTVESGGSTVSILGTSVPLEIAKALTWIAATYYTIIFYLEWRGARTLNSQAMTNEFGGGVNARLQQLSEDFENCSKQITNAAKAYVTAFEGVTGNMKRFEESVLAQDALAKQQPIPDKAFSGSNPSEDFILRASGFQAAQVKDHMAKLDKAAADRFSHFETTVRTDVALIQNQAVTNASANARVHVLLEGLAKDFHRLARTYTAEQRLMFYGTDLVAVLGLFTLGTAIFAPAGWHFVVAALSRTPS